LNSIGECAKVFRPGSASFLLLFDLFDERLFQEHEKGRHDLFVDSDDDSELILIVPFTGSIRLRKICFGAAGETCPSECRIFKNAEISFDNCNDVQPTQILKLGDDPSAELELAVMAPKFNDCRVLSLFFPSSRGGDKVGFSKESFGVCKKKD